MHRNRGIREEHVSQYAEVVLHAWIGKAVVAACNMASLFSARFLVAVTQHAGSSHVIIVGKNGNPWQLMQGLNHVHFAKAEHAAGGSLRDGFARIKFPLSLRRSLWICSGLCVPLCAGKGRRGRGCF